MAPPPLYGGHVCPKFMAVTLNLARAAKCLMGNLCGLGRDQGLKRDTITKNSVINDVESMFYEKSNS